jgi:cytoskeleton protein RodZ
VSIFQRIRTPFSESRAEEQARLQPRMRLIGELLEERREDLGLDLDEVGAMLKIKPAYLAALEQGRLQDLPGPAYAIGFVRAYAEFLGLDSEEVMTRFKAEAAGVTAPPDLSLPVPLGERSLPGGAMVLVALILALCGYGVWYYLSTEERSRPARVAAVPAALDPTPAMAPSRPAGAAGPAGAQNTADPGPQPSPTGGVAVAPSPPPTSSTSPAAPAAVSPAPQQAAVTTPPAASTAPAPRNGQTAPATVPSQAAPPPTTTQPQAVAPAQPQVQAAAPGPATSSPQPSANPAAAGGNGRVSIRALADCWIQVRAADDSIVFSRVLKSGEVYAVPQRAGLWLRTGNAGALEIAVDGKTAPSIGGVGTLRRDVALDPAELTAGTAVHG